MKSAITVTNPSNMPASIENRLILCPLYQLRIEALCEIIAETPTKHPTWRTRLLCPPPHVREHSVLTEGLAKAARSGYNSPSARLVVDSRG